jgi:hypothetical protein
VSCTTLRANLRRGLRHPHLNCLQVTLPIAGPPSCPSQRPAHTPMPALPPVQQLSRQCRSSMRCGTWNTACCPHPAPPQGRPQRTHLSTTDKRSCVLLMPAPAPGQPDPLLWPCPKHQERSCELVSCWLRLLAQHFCSTDADALAWPPAETPKSPVKPLSTAFKDLHAACSSSVQTALLPPLAAVSTSSVARTSA